MQPTKPCDGPPGDAPKREEDAGEPRILRSEALLAGHRQVVILHNNEQYVLRVTRQGKLILNK